MGTDRFVRWTSKRARPAWKTVIQTTRAFMGEIGTIELRDKWLIVNLPGETLGLDGIQAERWIEVWHHDDAVNVATRQADAATRSLANGLAEYLARVHDGTYERDAILAVKTEQPQTHAEQVRRAVHCTSEALLSAQQHERRTGCLSEALHYLQGALRCVESEDADASPPVIPPAIPASSLELLRHALGMSKHTSQRGWRNYFAAEPATPDYQAWEALEAANLARRGGQIPGGLVYFHATPAGCRLVGLSVKEIADACPRKTQSK